jgi:outer membrane protein OmpA-like peptidoglycan-associated protein
MIRSTRKVSKAPRTLATLVTALITITSFSQVAHANVVGSDAQNFNPITSGLEFVTVHSSETLRPGIINLGLFLNYAVNTLPYFGDSPQSRINFNDSLLGLDLNAGMGLTENWEIGLSLPQILRQAVSDESGARGEFAQTGATEIRLNTKYRVAGDDSGGFALVASMNVNRIENNPYIGSGAGPTINLEAAADTMVGKVAVGGNIGYRFRNPGEPIPGSLDAPLKSQWIGSAAASYFVSEWNTKVIGEIFGSLPAERSSSYGERSSTSLELLLGAKRDLTTHLAVHAGAGTELIEGFGSPDWRVYTGLNYTFGPVFSRQEPGSRHLVNVPPEPASPASRRFRTQSIHFDFDSDRMVGKYDAVLEELMAELKDGFRQLVIEGHTDSVGPEAYNEKLSLRRANSIKRYLVQTFKLDEAKILTIGYGETIPIADNANYQGRYKNRRVEFVIKR